MSSCRIKFGSITNLTDARYAAAVYCDWLGFCFDEGHPRYINPVKAKEIIDWLAGPEIVAEINDKDPEEMRSALEILGIRTVQCPAGKAELWKNAGFNVIAVCPVLDLYDALYDTEVFLTGYEEHMDISSFPKKHIIDITGLSLDDIHKLAEKDVYAVNITGGDEAKAGIRDFADADDILEILRPDE
jgi:phosphoribosylanthranilate isomerase